MTAPLPSRHKSKPFFLDRFAPTGRFGRFLYYYILLPFACLLVLYLLLNNVAMPLFTRHGFEKTLPDLVGKNIDIARQLLNAEGLETEVSKQEYHSDQPEGTIISQYPPAGTMVKSGRIIKLAVSTGKQMVTVPSLAGYSIRQAKLYIEAAGLSQGEIAWTYSDSLPEQVVVFSYPAVGTEVPSGTSINLMVNRGKLAGTIYMPKVIGLQLEDARKVIEGMGLKVGVVSQVRNDNFLPETVMQQSVEENTELEPGEEIDLVVSATE
ncbi:putative Serine/threonine-protein kinase Sps [Candidatus Zixiibacteriota bacterium]|nr:putative Serine/threonine-protein kinase Sps [candidate division Zixibacteria bacterium]